MPTENPEASEPQKFTAAEARAYVEKVIAKQAGLSPEQAAKRAAALPPEDFAAIHEAGRNGRVDDVRAILGL